MFKILQDFFLIIKFLVGFSDLVLGCLFLFNDGFELVLQVDEMLFCVLDLLQNLLFVFFFNNDDSFDLVDFGLDLQ